MPPHHFPPTCFFRTLFSSPTSTRVIPRPPSITPPLANRSASSSYHILHPTTRTRLTNLTFYLCAIVSITTVSLTMSGTLGNGNAIGCPARGNSGRVGVGAQEEEVSEEEFGRERRRANVGNGQGKKGKKESGRWLEDPVVEEKEVWRPGKDGKLQRIGPSLQGVELGRIGSEMSQGNKSVREEQKEGSETRIGNGKNERKTSRGTAWRDWVGLSGSEGSKAIESRTATSTGTTPGTESYGNERVV